VEVPVRIAVEGVVAWFAKVSSSRMRSSHTSKKGGERETSVKMMADGSELLVETAKHVEDERTVSASLAKVS
jgi:hypothetical protein